MNNGIRIRILNKSQTGIIYGSNNMENFDLLERFDELIESEEIVSKEDRKRIKYEAISFREKRFKKPRTCMYDGCKRNSIKRSHSIPKSKSLKIIADENNEVLTPEFNEQDDTFDTCIMKPVNINKASIFPGFCTKHEDIFKSFEETGEITNEYEMKLQSYRDICREIALRENEIDTINFSIKKYKEFRNRNYKRLIEERMKEKLKSVEITRDDTFLIVQSKIKKNRKRDIEILKKYNEHLIEAINGKEDDVYIQGITIDMKFPISICGIATTGIEENGVKRIVYCILNVIPNTKSTTIIVYGLKRDKIILDSYWNFYTQNNIMILNMIESFMIHGSDHWFINTKVWNEIPEDRQKIILKDIVLTGDAFLDEFPLSIFDEVRKMFIKQLERQQKLFPNEQIDKLIKKEKEKFNISKFKHSRTYDEAFKEWIDRDHTKYSSEY